MKTFKMNKWQTYLFAFLLVAVITLLKENSFLGIKDWGIIIALIAAVLYIIYAIVMYYKKRNTIS